MEAYKPAEVIGKLKVNRTMWRAQNTKLIQKVSALHENDTASHDKWTIYNKLKSNREPMRIIDVLENHISAETFEAERATVSMRTTQPAP